MFHRTKAQRGAISAGETTRNLTYTYKYLRPQNKVLGSAEYDINSGGVEVS